MVDSGDIVFINSGTTTTQVIRHVRSGADITVITNNLSAALEIGEPGFELVQLGGAFQPHSNSVAGSFAISNLSQIYANKAFIGVDGITLKHGFTVPTNAEAEVVRLMLERTYGPISVVADHSKWGVVSNFEVAKFEHVHRIVTDAGIGDTVLEALAERNIEVIVAGRQTQQEKLGEPGR